jgi:hypothetical protein
MVTLALIGESPDGELGFRIESAEEWEQHVQSLNSAAIFIVAHNSDMSWHGVRDRVP